MGRVRAHGNGPIAHASALQGGGSGHRGLSDPSLASIDDEAQAFTLPMQSNIIYLKLTMSMQRPSEF
jgi:hypothetical protein